MSRARPIRVTKRNEDQEEMKDAAAAAAVSGASDQRSYNSQHYWDQRYQYHLNQSTSTTNSTATSAQHESSAQAKPSKKRGRSSSTNAAAAAASATTIDATIVKEAESDDITPEWYYSFKDLSHILLPALKNVDKTQSVLDIGCGISTFFKQLQAQPKLSKGKGKQSKSSKTTTAESKTSSDDDEIGVGFTGDCIGLDYSPTVIQYLKKEYPSSQHPNLHWICGDACHLLPETEDEEPVKKKKKSSAKSSSDFSSSSAPPLLTPSEQDLFRPGTFSLILDKATSDGMLCSDHTARLTPLIYANVARLLAPNGLFVICSVNEPESGWFGEYVVSQLLEHGGSSCQWQIEVHTPSNYVDGEEGAPNVYLIKKFVPGFIHSNSTPASTPSSSSSLTQSSRSIRSSTQQQREPYTIKRICY